MYPVRILNPSNESIGVRAGTCCGHMTTVEDGDEALCPTHARWPDFSVQFKELLKKSTESLDPVQADAVLQKRQ